MGILKPGDRPLKLAREIAIDVYSSGGYAGGPELDREGRRALESELRSRLGEGYSSIIGSIIIKIAVALIIKWIEDQVMTPNPHPSEGDPDFE